MKHRQRAPSPQIARALAPRVATRVRAAPRCTGRTPAAEAAGRPSLYARLCQGEPRSETEFVRARVRTSRLGFSSIVSRAYSTFVAHPRTGGQNTDPARGNVRARSIHAARRAPPGRDALARPRCSPRGARRARMHAMRAPISAVDTAGHSPTLARLWPRRVVPSPRQPTQSCRAPSRRSSCALSPTAPIVLTNTVHEISEAEVRATLVESHHQPRAVEQTVHYPRQQLLDESQPSLCTRVKLSSAKHSELFHRSLQPIAR